MAIHLDSEERFLHRHLGPRQTDVAAMLGTLNVATLDELIDQALPQSIRTREPLQIGDPVDEYALQQQLKAIAARNEVYRSFIGLGYYDTITPPVIQRNILENPGWYTQYTPYQAEISQGRLEALLNFQTMVSDLTGLPLANASLLDEATAAAEAMTLLHRFHRNRNRFFVSEDCHPQTIAVLHTRAVPLGIDLVVGSHDSFQLDGNTFGLLLQYPTTDGQIVDYRSLCQAAHDAGASVVMAADLLSLVLLTPPGELGADIAVGNTQRFGVPLGYGGPHAAYFATQETFKRQIPGRIIGLSKDRQRNPALRMALQTREQHIRRERATSNICTAQVLLAIMAGMYAVYHGPRGLKRIATRIHDRTKVLAALLQEQGHQLVHQHWFDTLRLRPNGRSAEEILQAAWEKQINLRPYEDGTVGISLDETTTLQDLETLASIFGTDPTRLRTLAEQLDSGYQGPLQRQTPFLSHPVFNQYHSETELVRYLHRLESRDLSLTTSMIPLGSCTMKLNATTLMLPVSWEAFNRLHPFAPADQTQGYQQIFKDLETWLTDITGFAACSLQPNSGAQGEFTGLMVIQAYHRDHGQEQRRVCLIPASAHGTNPASSVMAGMEVVIVECDEQGNIDIQDLAAKAAAHKEDLSAFMVTYPSTHGVFEEQITTICELIHQHGGLVYLDGANLNALVGLSRLGEWGADVCHINLHKTFAIPHGGGGPGMGPICVTADLAPYLPTHPLAKCGGEKGITPVSAAPWGSASILPISWAYIRLLGSAGLTQATRLAILNANYMAARLKDHFPILYRGQGGWVAHEFILDLRPLKKRTGITEEDVSKRLMDYGFHAPTTSFPVHGTLMIEPTESESKAELDRFCDALIAIKEEILDIERGMADPVDNVLKNAPHTAAEIASPEWNHPYSREQAAYPAPWTREHKFWPPVGRIDNAYGDRHLMCTCPPVSDYTNK
jgi:glycine dehydrogenase